MEQRCAMHKWSLYGQLCSRVCMRVVRPLGRSILYCLTLTLNGGQSGGSPFVYFPWNAPYRSKLWWGEYEATAGRGEERSNKRDGSSGKQMAAPYRSSSAW